MARICIKKKYYVYGKFIFQDSDKFEVKFLRRCELSSSALSSIVTNLFVKKSHRAIIMLFLDSNRFYFATPTIIHTVSTLAEQLARIRGINCWLGQSWVRHMVKTWLYCHEICMSLLLGTRLKTINATRKKLISYQILSKRLLHFTRLTTYTASQFCG